MFAEAETEQTSSQTTPDRGVRRTQSVAIVAATIIASLAPLAVVGSLPEPVDGHTVLLYYFNSLVILPLLSTLGFVCAIQLLERTTWRGFGIVLVTFCAALCLYAVIQWIRFDLLFNRRIIVTHTWTIIGAGVMIASVVSVIAGRLAVRNRHMRLKLTLVGISAFCLTIGAFQFVPGLFDQRKRLDSRREFSPEDMVGASAPAFSLASPDHRIYSLEDNKGKVTVLNFWATWCGPCVSEMPDLQKASQEFRNDAAVFMAVSIDRDTSKVRTFIDSLGYSFTTLYGTTELKKAYVIQGIPATFLIDKQGVIRKVYLGFFNQIPGQMESLIRKLLAE